MFQQAIFLCLAEAGINVVNTEKSSQQYKQVICYFSRFLVFFSFQFKSIWKSIRIRQLMTQKKATAKEIRVRNW